MSSGKDSDFLQLEGHPTEQERMARDTAARFADEQVVPIQMSTMTKADSAMEISAMRCELVTDFSRLEELSPDWQRWARGNESSTIFQQWEWARAYWKACGSSLSLCSLAIHREEKTLGILPLVRRGDAIEFLGSLESDYNDLLCEDGWAVPVLQVAMEFLLQSPLPWTSGVLEHIPAHSQIVRNIPYLPEQTRRHLQLVFGCPSPAIIIDRTRPELLDALIDKEQLRRYHKKLQKLGPLLFRHFETREEAREHLDRFFHQHITRSAMTGRQSQFLSTERRAFFEALVDEFDPARQVRFGALELDSRPIAYHFGFQFNGTLTWYKPAFDVNYWEHCPGDVLLRSLLAYVREAELGELDFTIGDEPFKLRFANQVRRNYVLHMERHPGRIGNRVHAVVRNAQHVIRQKPEWMAALKDKARRLDDFVSRVRRLDSGEGFLKNCQNGLRAACRWIWSRDEVLLYRGLGESGVGVSAVKIAPATLDDVASLSVEFDHFLNAAKLHEYRRRLKQGDQVFIARGNPGEAFVLWLGWRSEIEVPEVGSDCNLPLATPSLVVDECWMAPDAAIRRVSSEVLQALAGHLAGSRFWIYDVRGRGSLGQAVEDAGLELQHRLIRRSFFHRFSRTRVLSFSETDDSQQESVCSSSLHAEL